jgi:hypothetical protein
MNMNMMMMMMMMMMKITAIPLLSSPQSVAVPTQQSRLFFSTGV